MEDMSSRELEDTSTQDLVPQFCSSEDSEAVSLDLYVETLVSDQKQAKYFVPPSPFHQTDSRFDIYSGLDENSQSASDSFTVPHPPSLRVPSPDCSSFAVQRAAVCTTEQETTGDSATRKALDQNQSSSAQGGEAFLESKGAEDYANPVDMYQQNDTPSKEGYSTLLKKYAHLKANMIKLLSSARKEISSLTAVNNQLREKVCQYGVGPDNLNGPPLTSALQNGTSINETRPQIRPTCNKAVQVVATLAQADRLFTSKKVQADMVCVLQTESVQVQTHISVDSCSTQTELLKFQDWLAACSQTPVMLSKAVQHEVGPSVARETEVANKSVSGCSQTETAVMWHKAVQYEVGPSVTRETEVANKSVSGCSQTETAVMWHKAVQHEVGPSVARETEVTNKSVSGCSQTETAVMWNKAVQYEVGPSVTRETDVTSKLVQTMTLLTPALDYTPPFAERHGAVINHQGLLACSEQSVAAHIIPSETNINGNGAPDPKLTDAERGGLVSIDAGSGEPDVLAGRKRKLAQSAGQSQPKRPAVVSRASEEGCSRFTLPDSANGENLPSSASTETVCVSETGNTHISEIMEGKLEEEHREIHDPLPQVIPSKTASFQHHRVSYNTASNSLSETALSQHHSVPYYNTASNSLSDTVLFEHHRVPYYNMASNSLSNARRQRTRDEAVHSQQSSVPEFAETEEEESMFKLPRPPFSHPQPACIDGSSPIHVGTTGAKPVGGPLSQVTGDEWKKMLLMWPRHSHRTTSHCEEIDAILAGNLCPLIYEFTTWETSPAAPDSLELSLPHGVSTQQEEYQSESRECVVAGLLQNQTFDGHHKQEKTVVRQPLVHEDDTIEDTIVQKESRDVKKMLPGAVASQSEYLSSTDGGNKKRKKEKKRLKRDARNSEAASSTEARSSTGKKQKKVKKKKEHRKNKKTSVEVPAVEPCVEIPVVVFASVSETTVEGLATTECDQGELEVEQTPVEQTPVKGVLMPEESTKPTPKIAEASKEISNEKMTELVKLNDGKKKKKKKCEINFQKMLEKLQRIKDSASSSSVNSISQSCATKSDSSCNKSSPNCISLSGSCCSLTASLLGGLDERSDPKHSPGFASKLISLEMQPACKVHEEEARLVEDDHQNKLHPKSAITPSKAELAEEDRTPVKQYCQFLAAPAKAISVISHGESAIKEKLSRVETSMGSCRPKSNLWEDEEETVLDYVDFSSQQITPVRQTRIKSALQEISHLTPKSVEKLKNTTRMLSQSSLWSPEKLRLQHEDSMNTQTFHDLLGISNLTQSMHTERSTAPVTSLSLDDCTAAGNLLSVNRAGGKTQSCTDVSFCFQTGLKFSAEHEKIPDGGKAHDQIHADSLAEKKAEKKGKKLTIDADEPLRPDDDNIPLFGYPSDINVHKEAAMQKLRYKRAPNFLASSSSSSLTSSAATSKSSLSMVTVLSDASSTMLADKHQSACDFEKKLLEDVEEEKEDRLSGAGVEDLHDQASRPLSAGEVPDARAGMPSLLSARSPAFLKTSAGLTQICRIEERKTSEGTPEQVMVFMGGEHTIDCSDWAQHYSVSSEESDAEMSSSFEDAKASSSAAEKLSTPGAEGPFALLASKRRVSLDMNLEGLATGRTNSVDLAEESSAPNVSIPSGPISKEQSLKVFWQKQEVLEEGEPTVSGEGLLDLVCPVVAEQSRAAESCSIYAGDAMLEEGEIVSRDGFMIDAEQEASKGFKRRKAPEDRDQYTHLRKNVARKQDSSVSHHLTSEKHWARKESFRDSSKKDSAGMISGKCSKKGQADEKAKKDKAKEDQEKARQEIFCRVADVASPQAQTSPLQRYKIPRIESRPQSCKQRRLQPEEKKKSNDSQFGLSNVKERDMNCQDGKEKKGSQIKRQSDILHKTKSRQSDNIRGHYSDVDKEYSWERQRNLKSPDHTSALLSGFQEGSRGKSSKEKGPPSLNLLKTEAESNESRGNSAASGVKGDFTKCTAHGNQDKENIVSEIQSTISSKSSGIAALPEELEQPSMQSQDTEEDSDFIDVENISDDHNCPADPVDDPESEGCCRTRIFVYHRNPPKSMVTELNSELTLRSLEDSVNEDLGKERKEKSETSIDSELDKYAGTKGSKFHLKNPSQTVTPKNCTERDMSDAAKNLVQQKTYTEGLAIKGEILTDLSEGEVLDSDNEDDIKIGLLSTAQDQISIRLFALANDTNRANSYASADCLSLDAFAVGDLQPLDEPSDTAFKGDKTGDHPTVNRFHSLLNSTVSSVGDSSKARVSLAEKSSSKVSEKPSRSSSSKTKESELLKANRGKLNKKCETRRGAVEEYQSFRSRRDSQEHRSKSPVARKTSREKTNLKSCKRPSSEKIVQTTERQNLSERNRPRCAREQKITLTHKKTADNTSCRDQRGRNCKDVKPQNMRDRGESSGLCSCCKQKASSSAVGARSPRARTRSRSRSRGRRNLESCCSSKHAHPLVKNIDVGKLCKMDSRQTLPRKGHCHCDKRTPAYSVSHDSNHFRRGERRRPRLPSYTASHRSRSPPASQRCRRSRTRSLDPHRSRSDSERHSKSPHHTCLSQSRSRSP